VATVAAVAGATCLHLSLHTFEVLLALGSFASRSSSLHPTRSSRQPRSWSVNWIASFLHELCEASAAPLLTDATILGDLLAALPPGSEMIGTRICRLVAGEPSWITVDLLEAAAAWRPRLVSLRRELTRISLRLHTADSVP
jgi:hypothetical protein